MQNQSRRAELLRELELIDLPPQKKVDLELRKWKKAATKKIEDAENWILEEWIAENTIPTKLILAHYRDVVSLQEKYVEGIEPLTAEFVRQLLNVNGTSTVTILRERAEKPILDYRREWRARRLFGAPKGRTRGGEPVTAKNVKAPDGKVSAATFADMITDELQDPDFSTRITILARVLQRRYKAEGEPAELEKLREKIENLSEALVPLNHAVNAAIRKQWNLTPDARQATRERAAAAIAEAKATRDKVQSQIETLRNEIGEGWGAR